MTAMLAWSQGQDLVAVKVAGISHSLHAARSLQPVPCCVSHSGASGL